MNIDMKLCSCIVCSLLTLVFSFPVGAQMVINQSSPGTVRLAGDSRVIPLLVDETDEVGIKLAAAALREDFNRVTGVRPELLSAVPGNDSPILIIGTLGKSRWIDQLVKEKKIEGKELTGKWEKYLIQQVEDSFPGVQEAVVIAGSDKRGTIYDIYELSDAIGVSPWYYWADVPVRKSGSLFFKRGVYTDGEPAVKYRGIFLNDKWPSLGGWATSTFGGFNSQFYEKVFELILRLKGNYLWPAMWNSAFYDDDPRNGVLADEMEIVIGTSHHEPMGRAHKEWSRYGSGAWDYAVNRAVLDEFWRGGTERLKD